MSALTRRIGAIGVDGKLPCGRYRGANTQWHCFDRGLWCIRWRRAASCRRRWLRVRVRGRLRGLAMRVLRILGVVVVRGMRNLRIRIAVVPLAKLSAAIVVAGTFWRRRSLFPVDILARAIVPGDIGAAPTAAAGLPAPPPTGIRRTSSLAGIAGFHRLSRIYRLVLQVVLDRWAHLGPVFLGPVVA